MLKKFWLFVFVAIVSLAAAVPQAGAQRAGSVTFTFDDGLASFDMARKALLKYYFRATLFPIANRIGWENYLEDWQLIDAAKVHEIGFHGRYHDGEILSYDEILAEKQGAQRDFRRLGIRMSGSFAPPHGAYDSAVIQRLLDEGIITSSRQAWIEDTLYNKPLNWERGAIRAVSIRTTTSIKYLRQICSTASERGWSVVLVFHDIIPTGAVAKDEHDFPMWRFRQLIEHVQWLREERGFQVLTISQMVRKLNRLQSNLP